MIIKANTPEGVKTKIFLKDGTQCRLPIYEYNTETQEAVMFIMDENGKVKTTDWVKDEASGKMERQIIYKTEIIEGSYAEVNGKRV